MTTHDPSMVSHDVRLPAEVFYWGVLDTSALPTRSSPTTTQLGYLFETVLPVAIEDIQAVYLHLDRHRTLACGMAVDTLTDQIASHPITLGPAALPDFLCESLASSVELQEINLLTGRFEPKCVTSARQRFVLVSAVLVLVGALIVAAGFHRRTTAANDIAEAYAHATDAIYEQVLPRSQSTLTPSVRLIATLRLLDRTRSSGAATQQPREASGVLANLLASWPTDMHLRTESLSVGPAAITLSVRLPDSESAQRFEHALKSPANWHLIQPTVQAQREGILMRVRMEPNP